MRTHQRFHQLFANPRIIKAFFSCNSDLVRLLCDLNLIVVSIWDCARVQPVPTECLLNCPADVGEQMHQVSLQIIQSATVIPATTPKQYMARFAARQIALKVASAPSSPGGLPKYLQVYEPGCELSKVYQTRDWRIRPLPRPMITYAAKDAFATRLIFKRQVIDLLLHCPGSFHTVLQQSNQLFAKTLDTAAASTHAHCTLDVHWDDDHR